MNTAFNLRLTETCKVLACYFLTLNIAIAGLGDAQWQSSRTHEQWLIALINKAGFECRKIKTVTLNGLRNDGMVDRYAVWCENKAGHAYDFYEFQHYQEQSDWCISITVGNQPKEVCIDPITKKITEESG
ncbi:MAG: hypothetical protein OXC42_06750 [Gammaproteobacteria bacterium]|nr:hypothetical protein [Gammaproteobacteria bacterium]